jgi:hypothetical protein
LHIQRLLWLGHVMAVLFEEDLSKLAQILRQRNEDAIHHATFHESVGHADGGGSDLLKLLGESGDVDAAGEDGPANIHSLNLFLVRRCMISLLSKGSSLRFIM